MSETLLERINQLEIPEGPGATGQRRSMQLLTGDELAALPPPAWQIDNLLPKGAMAVLFGPSGGGKTFLALDIALAIAHGKNWHGVPLLNGPVVYIAAEGSGGLASRLTAWKQANLVQGLDRIHFLRAPVQFMESPEVHFFLLAITAALREPPAFICIDTMARCLVGGDENSARDVGLFVAGVDRLRFETGATVMVVHHTGKAGTAERGSSALRAAADTMLSLTGEPDDELELKIDKQKDAAPPKDPIRLKLRPLGDSCVISIAAACPDSGGVPSKARQALETLRLYPDGVSFSEWQDISQMPKMTFARARRTLLERGLIYSSGRGNSTRYFATDKPV